MATFYAQKKKVFAFTMVLAMLITMFMSSIALFASSATPDAQAHRDLTIYVQSQMSNKEYAVEGGGTIEGADLFDGSPTDGYDLNEDEFQNLTNSAQADVVADIAENSNAAIEETDTVSESTVQNWWKQLQSKDGVGSKFLNEILKNTKPDFVTANAIYEPFSGLDPVNSQILKDVVSEQIADGKLVIFSSHQMSYVEEFCEDIVLINRGEIVLSGALSQIKRAYGKNRLIIGMGYGYQDPGQVLTDYMGDLIRVVGRRKEQVIVEMKAGCTRELLLREFLERELVPEEFGNYEPSLTEIFVEKAGDQS